jgi:hypothetical protein
MRLHWLLSGCLIIPSCNSDCVAIAGMAVVVDVTDARTGAFLAAGSTLLVYGPAGADSITYPAHVVTERAIGISEGRIQPGTYTVEVRRDGYTSWARSGIVLRDSGDCGHIETVCLSAELVPLP